MVFVADPIGVIFSAISLTITILYFYYVYFAIKGFWKNLPSPPQPPKNKFAILVPAYNEERVIGKTIRSLKSVDYPEGLFDIYVITDDSKDKTVEVANEEGAIVLERGEACEPGKGHALKWGIEQVKMHSEYDAFIIIDADNTVSKNFLALMNNELIAGHRVIQAHLKSKNPTETWVSKTIHADYVTRNRFFKQPRAEHNLCVFAEPGICISAELLNKYGWNFTSITEDLELTCKLACDGIRIRWIRDAEIYEERPNTLSVAIKQRKRWMTGHADALVNYTRRLFRAFRKDRNTIALDCALYLLFPAFMLAWLVGQIAFIASGSRFTILAILPENLHDTSVVAFFNIFLAFWWVVVPWAALYLDKENVAKYWYAPISIMLMAFIQMFLFAYGMVRRRDRTWWHTPHGVSAKGRTAYMKSANPTADPPDSPDGNKK
ncbi:MAG: glycosyltransferase [Thermoplasmata archaeon]|nr:glycosyltransferase [Thermoplasmata archaeon]